MIDERECPGGGRGWRTSTRMSGLVVSYVITGAAAVLSIGALAHAQRTRVSLAPYVFLNVTTSLAKSVHLSCDLEI